MLTGASRVAAAGEREPGTVSNRVKWGNERVMGYYKQVLLLVALVQVPAVFADDRVQQVRTDWAVLQDVQRDFRARRAQLSATEQADYRAYIDRLSRRVADGCEVLRTDGIAPPAEVVCPRELAPAGPVAIDQRGEQTRLEATAELDAELDAGLGDFDQRLLREQERVKAQTPRSASATAGGGAGTGTGDAAGAAGGEASDAGSPSADAARPARPAGTPASGSGRTPPRGSVPADIPNGADDDVVARQIREAAEYETDPQLREKLWDEYRKYKQGTR